MIYEFLYRGPTATNKMLGGWHILLADDNKPLNPTQAEAAGFPLKTVLAEINTEVMKQKDALEVAAADLATKFEQKSSELTDEKAKSAALQKALDEKAATLDQVVSVGDARISELTSQLEALNAHASVLATQLADAQKVKV